MLKIKNPKTEKFRELLEDGNPYELEQAFSIFTDENHTLSFVTDTHVIFLHEQEIKKCFDIFTTSLNQDWDKYIEETSWADDYSESFAKRCRKEMGIKKSENPLWFYSLIEEGMNCYIDAYKETKKLKEEGKVNELTRLYWCDPYRKDSGYIISKSASQLDKNRCDIVLEGHSELIDVYKDEIIEVLMSTYGTSLDALIANPKYDKAYYLGNIGGAEYKYKGHTLTVSDQHETFVNGNEIKRNNPHLLLENKHMFTVKTKATILIQKVNSDGELETVGIRYNMKDAKDYIDLINCSDS